MDHGTTGISFCIMSENGDIVDIFKIDREDSKSGKVSAVEELSKKTDLNSIKLMTVTYAMGDGFNKILPLEKIENSEIPIIMVPGLHKNSTSLDKLFNAAYSHQASPEKVCISYNALLETNWENFIVADISSNSVNILIENSKIKGAVDACLGAMGIVHGPLDLEMIRDIDEGKSTANECFSHAGAVKIAGINTKVANMKDQLLENFENNDEKAKLAIDTLIMAVAMEIAGLEIVCRNEIDGIVLTGSIGSMTHPFNFKDEINKYFKDKFELKVISKESGAVGAAQIAYDIYNGKDNILGIEVDLKE